MTTTRFQEQRQARRIPAKTGGSIRRSRSDGDGVKGGRWGPKDRGGGRGTLRFGGKGEVRESRPRRGRESYHNRRYLVPVLGPLGLWLLFSSCSAKIKESVSGDCGGPSEPSHPADLVRVGLLPSPALYT